MVVVKVETVKGERKFQGIGSSLLLIGREEGVRGYFKGNGTNVMRIVPYVAVQFASYEEYKKVNTHTLSLSLSLSLSHTHTHTLSLSLSLSHTHTHTHTHTHPPLPPTPVARDTGRPSGAEPSEKTCGRRSCRHHLRHSHIPSRPRPHTTLCPGRGT